MGVSSITVLFVLNLVRLLFLIPGLFPLKLLDQESTLVSGMFWVNEITLFSFLRVDVTRQIHHVISLFIFTFLGFQGPLGFPLNFP